MVMMAVMMTGLCGQNNACKYGQCDDGEHQVTNLHWGNLLTPGIGVDPGYSG